MRCQWQQRFALVTLLSLCAELTMAPLADANPTGAEVVLGQADIAGLGTDRVTIAQASQLASINWQSFNIAPNEVTHFIQPNVHAIALNRIFDQNPSQILGRLEANGTVILMNRNGIMFGPTAQVNVGGLIASTHYLSDANFLRGHYLFEGAGVEGMVKNAGTMVANTDGLYLLAQNVENSGVMTAPGGTIMLGAGRSAFLSNHPDGRGFLTEITAPTGKAVNVKDLIADGGRVTLAGYVVNQEGLIQANSVKERSGAIELLATNAVTLKDGSRTIARGSDGGVSSGGTIRAIADLTSGTAKFEKGAVVDVSGGKSGGHAGFAEISAASVNLRGQFYGRAPQGYTGGRFLIDPSCVAGSPCSVDAAEIDSFANSGASLVEFRSADGFGLTVTGAYDLAAGQWQLPAGQRGTIRFTASTDDLVFQNFSLTNTGSGVAWDYVGTADNHVRFNQSYLETGFGGNMEFTATRGSISLMESTNTGGNLVAQGALSTIRTPEAGGNISLTAGQDVISPSVFVRDGRLASGNATLDRFGGIRLDGIGDLHITAGRDFVGGGLINGRLFGPGFVLTNGKAVVTAQQIGGPLNGVSGLDNQYAQLTMASGEITLTATTGNIYLGRIQDKGLSDLDSGVIGPDGNVIKTISVNPNNKVTVNVNEGDLYLNPSQLSRNGTPLVGTNVYPASFVANVPKGNVFFENNVSFWGSPTGTVTFQAGKNIQGTALGFPPALTNQYQWIFVGAVNNGGTWVLVDLAKAAKNSILSPFVYTANGEKQPPTPLGQLPPVPPNTANSNDVFIPVNSEYVFVGEVGRGGQWVVVDKSDPQLNFNPHLAPYLTRAVPQGAPDRPVPVGTPITFPVGPASLAQRTVSLLQADPAVLNGPRPSNLSTLVRPEIRTTNPIPDHAPVDVKLEAGLANVAGEGNIKGLVLNLGSVPFKKKITISAADNLETVTAIITAPTGVESLVKVGKSINFGQGGQIAFAGTGTGRIQVGGNLDLGSSAGIRFRRFPTDTSDQNQGGFLDVAVGGEIIMDRSRISTYNGASISVHGLTKNALTDTLIGTAVVGPDGTRVSVMARNAAGQIVPQEVKFEGKTLTLTGAEERLDPSPLTVHVALVEQSGQLVTRNGDRVEVLRVDGKPVLFNGDLVLVKPEVLVKPDGTVVRDGGTVLLAQASNVSEVGASGGGVKVGSNVAVQNSDNDALGIVTRFGGAIDIKSTGDINVDKSRIATLAFPAAGTRPYQAGDINLVSLTGNINAGSGGANEAIPLAFTIKPVDPSTGRPLPEENVNFEVPGSGIFTYHGGDQKLGELLVFPRFDDPEINAVRAEISKLGFLGRDTSALRTKEMRLLAEREPIFTRVFENFIVGKQLGNVRLVAHEGNIVVPVAGIRGRRIDLLAPNGALDLQGGVIAGLTRFAAATVTGSLSSSFSGTVSGSSGGSSVSGASSAGGGTLGGITGATGSVSAASSSATAATTSTAVKASADVQEGAAEVANQGDAKAKQVASKNDKDKKGNTVAQSIKMKHGVIIQVDVKPQSGG